MHMLIHAHTCLRTPTYTYAYTYTYTYMYSCLQNLLKMGSLSQVMGMLPGMQNMQMGPDQEKASVARVKGFMTIMDSMTQQV